MRYIYSQVSQGINWKFFCRQARVRREEQKFPPHLHLALRGEAGQIEQPGGLQKGEGNGGSG